MQEHHELLDDELPLSPLELDSLVSVLASALGSVVAGVSTFFSGSFLVPWFSPVGALMLTCAKTAGEQANAIASISIMCLK